jgi:ubiquinone/menaquinone biosynthesis C-methylase UbiE
MSSNDVTIEEMRKFDGMAESISNEALMSGALHRADKHFRMRVLSAVFNLLPVEELNGKRVLDVGGGPASYTSSLARLVSDATCLDFSSAMLSKGKKRTKALKMQIEFIRANAENLPFNENSFNYVTAFATLHHVPDWRTCLRDMIRVTKEKVIVVEPNGASLPHLANEVIALYRPRIKKWRITGEWRIREPHHLLPWEIRQLFRELGLINIQLKFLGFVPEVWPIPNFALKFLALVEKICERIPLLNMWAGSFLVAGAKTANPRICA